MRNHIVNGISELAEQDSRIVMVTADLGFGVLEGFAKRFPDRYINCGIAEQNMAAIAAGLALEGDVVFTYSIGNFPTLRCLEQIRNDICYHNANVKILAVGGGFSYGSLGMTHHATEDLSIMRSLPNMRVYAPADPVEAGNVLQEVYQHDGPCYVRLARGSDPVLHTNCIGMPHLFPDIAATVDVSILTTGTIYVEGETAQKELQEAGISVALYSVPCVKPIDNAVIRRISEKSKLLVTVEENQVAGGFGSSVAEILSSSGNHPPILRIGLKDTYTSIVGNQMYLRQYYKMDGDSIAQQTIGFMKGIDL